MPAGAIAVEGLHVTADGRDCTLRTARVAPADAKRRWLAMDDAQHPTDYFDTAAFVNVPVAGPPDKTAHVVVAYRGPITAAKLLPGDTRPTIQGNTVAFDVKAGQSLTLELNGDTTRSLHLFAGPPTVGHTPGALVFGPGIHYVKDTIDVTDGQTVEIDDDAILYATAGTGPLLRLKGRDIVVRGRGILDGSFTPRHTRHLISVEDAQHVTIDGPTLRDCSIWNLQIRRSDHVTVRDVNVLGYRANSDGIDVCNSRDVTIERCFVRTLDDLIVVKTDKGQGPARDIAVRHCVLWNQVAHALSIGAEIREPTENVTFEDCDVLHDVGREWTLRVFNTDGGAVRNVRFENVRIGDTQRLISLWVGKAVWSRDATRGSVENVTFRNVTCASGTAAIELTGTDADHGVRGVTFDGVKIAGQPLRHDQIKTNAAATGVTVRP